MNMRRIVNLSCIFVATIILLLPFGFPDLCATVLGRVISLALVTGCCWIARRDIPRPPNWKVVIPAVFFGVIAPSFVMFPNPELNRRLAYLLVTPAETVVALSLAGWFSRPSAH